MPKGNLRRYDSTAVLQAVADGDFELLQNLCPCRNQVLDRTIWRELFEVAQHGSRRSRGRAAHAIATLLSKAQTSPAWRELLRDLDDDLARAMQNPRTRSALIGQVAHQAGHARTLKRSGLQTLRHQRRVLDLASRADLVAWLNEELGLAPHRGVSGSHPGLDRLWRWLSHRTTYQHRRRLRDEELRGKAARWLPEYFGTGSEARLSTG